MEQTAYFLRGGGFFNREVTSRIKAKASPADKSLIFTDGPIALCIIV